MTLVFVLAVANAGSYALALYAGKKHKQFLKRKMAQESYQNEGELKSRGVPKITRHAFLMVFLAVPLSTEAIKIIMWLRKMLLEMQFRFVGFTEKNNRS